MHSDNSVQALLGGYKVGDIVYSLVSRDNFDLDSDSDSEDAPPNVVPGSKGNVTDPALLSHYDEPNQATEVGVWFKLGGSTDMPIKISPRLHHGHATTDTRSANGAHVAESATVRCSWTFVHVLSDSGSGDGKFSAVATKFST